MDGLTSFDDEKFQLYAEGKLCLECYHESHCGTECECVDCKECFCKNCKSEIIKIGPTDV